MTDFASVDDALSRLAAQRYLASRDVATTVFLAQAMERPLLLEGEAGVGKTELAKAIAEARGARLIRLQCYEGVDAAQALYEWNYPRQLLHIRLATAESAGGSPSDESRGALERSLFGEEYLVRRPLLEAILSEDEEPPVLLVDEIDRADEEFEAFLLEVLSDFQISIPELGTLAARRRPYVVLTSNRTRELHDAVKRRCLYLWLDYPDVEREQAILAARVPGIAEGFARQICEFMSLLRERDFYKRPGVAETIDWATALIALSRETLDEEAVEETLGCIFKYRDDLERFRESNIGQVLAQVDIDRSM